MLPRRLARLPRTPLAGDVAVLEATTFASRLLGLALLAELPAAHALLIPNCRSVHTFGMRFAIDIAFLDARGRPLRAERGVPPRRLLRCSRAFAVLESNAGELDRFVGAQ
jgi:uncharacterized membrane protein (UPF0127 family)